MSKPKIVLPEWAETFSKIIDHAKDFPAKKQMKIITGMYGTDVQSVSVIDFDADEIEEWYNELLQILGVLNSKPKEEEV